MRTALFLLMLALAAPASARVYQWVEPDSETPQLSGKPPTWYRSREGGPRVFVFEKGQLIDDTATEVSEIDRARLREEALIQAERDQAAINERLLEAKRMQAIQDRNRPPEEELPLVVEQAPPPDALPAPPPTPDAEATMDAMRALVEQWDARQTENARGVVGGGTP